MSFSNAADLIFFSIISANCVPKLDLLQTKCFAAFDTMTLDQSSILSVLYLLIVYSLNPCKLLSVPYIKNRQKLDETIYLTIELLVIFTNMIYIFGFVQT